MMETKFVCSACGVMPEVKPEKEPPARRPPGWHMHHDVMFCGDCWKMRYRRRAVTLPISGPADMKEWPVLETALAEAWLQTTQISNFAVRQLYVNDVLPSPGDEKLAPMPKFNLYKAATQAFPDFGCGSLSAITREVTSKYKTARWRILFKGDMSLPNYRYPAPLPIRAQDYSMEELDGGRVAMKTRIGSTKSKLGRSWTLILRGGKRYRRQMVCVRQAIRGEGALAAAVLYRKPKSNGTNRHSIVTREPGGKRKQDNDLMVKIVLWVQKRARAAAEGRLIVRTRPDAMLVARMEDDSRTPWRLNRDDLPRKIAAHQWRLQRFSEDMKAEVREQKKHLQEALKVFCTKHNNYLKMTRQQLAASLVNFAVRRRVAEIVYDDSERGYLPDFAWSLFWSVDVPNALSNVTPSPELVNIAEYKRRAEEKKETDEAVQQYTALQVVLSKMLSNTEDRDDDESNGDATGGE